MNKEFEQWFINQDFYTNMRFIHGDTLFLKDCDVYRVLPVHIAYCTYQDQQKKIDALLDHTCGTYEDWQGGVIGDEYDSLKGTKEFLGQWQEKLGNCGSV